MTKLQQHLDRVRDFVVKLPTTNWVIYTGTVAGLFSITVFWVLAAFDRFVPLDQLVTLLAFLAGWIGFGVRQFRHKRETHFNENGGHSIRERTREFTATAKEVSP